MATGASNCMVFTFVYYVGGTVVVLAVFVSLTEAMRGVVFGHWTCRVRGCLSILPRALGYEVLHLHVCLIVVFFLLVLYCQVSRHLLEVIHMHLSLLAILG